MTAMDSTKMIADLCAVIDRMNVIIQAQAMELAQFGAVVHAEEIAEVRQKYARAIGEGVGPWAWRKSCWAAAGRCWRP